ncbi:hypothetical protein GCM10010353_73220 [Streptomyces chryseus]|nr:hypothetical protein GCM10010353_73220 [Streptomyces chryseus]
MVWVRARLSREGGKYRLLGDMAAGDAKGAGERQPVGVEAGLVGGVVHDVPQCVMHEKEAVDFLLDTVWVLRAQDGP